MAATPNRFSRKPKKNALRDTICLTCLAAIDHTKVDCSPLENSRTHICDSAFLAERGIFTRLDNGTFHEESMQKLPFNHVQAA